MTTDYTDVSLPLGPYDYDDLIPDEAFEDAEGELAAGAPLGRNYTATERARQIMIEEGYVEPLEVIQRAHELAEQLERLARAYAIDFAGTFTHAQLGAALGISRQRMHQLAHTDPEAASPRLRLKASR